MQLISHRGNIFGPIPEKENHPNYIDCAINDGYHVEIDIRVINGEIWLGHDDPQYKISNEWLNDRRCNLWIHCKNIDSLYEFCTSKDDYNYFWHQNDDFTLTNKNYIWTYPGKSYTSKSIIVMPELFTDIYNLTNYKTYSCYGICSDYIGVI